MFLCDKIINMSLHSNKPVIILGSKPECHLPDVEPEIVFAANGAVEIGLFYRKKYGSKLISMVPGKDLFEQEHIRHSIKQSQPDHIILLGTTHIESNTLGYVNKELQLDSSKVSIMSMYERNWVLVKSLGWRRYVYAMKNSLVRGLRHPLTVALPDVLTNRVFDWTGRSTGINASLYALREYPEHQVVMAGIGLVAGGHFNNEGVFKKKTAQADQIMMQYWVPKLRKQLFTTDDVMHEMGKVPKWEGPLYTVPVR